MKTLVRRDLVHTSAGDGLHDLEWSRILKIKTGRKIEVDSSGIAWDRAFTGGGSQASELKRRDSIASKFLHSPKEAFREATRHHSNGVMRRRARQVLDELSGSGLGVERVLVDLGVGFGWHWQELAREFPSIKLVLVDFALSNLLLCRALMPFHEYPNVLCLHADIADLPLENHLVDYCWSVQAHQHLPPVKRRCAFKELKRIMKPSARFYLAWLRAVPLVKWVYWLLRKPYHEGAQAGEGTYFQRYDETISQELRAEFGSFHLRYSEVLFHPDLAWSPSNRAMGAMDLWLSSALVAPFLARQVEIWGAAESLTQDS